MIQTFKSEKCYSVELVLLLVVLRVLYIAAPLP